MNGIKLKKLIRTNFIFEDFLFLRLNLFLQINKTPVKNHKKKYFEL